MYVKPLNLFLLALVGVIISFGINFQFANAQIAIDPASISYNDNGNFVPYKLIQNSNTVSIYSGQGSYVFNKNTCSLSFYNSNSPTGSPIISSDSYSVIASQGNTGIWNPVSIINNAACTTSVTENNGTISIIGTKSVTGAGVFSINYTKLPFQPLKLSFSATNNNPSWTNYHIGLSENLQVPQIISLGDNSYDLSQYNNTVLNRNWLASHNGQLIKLTKNLEYNTGIGWNHVNQITIHWINNQASLQIDYNYNTPIISPGQTITIDPSITLDAVTTTSATSSTNATQTISVTVGSNTNRAMIVGISLAKSGAGIVADVNNDVISSVKIGPLSFTKAVNRTYYNSTQGYGYDTELWYLINPPTGSSHVTITPATTSSYTISAGAYSLYNVIQGSPIGVTATNSSTTVSSSIAITPTHVGSWLVENIITCSTGGGTCGTAPTNPSGTQGWSILPAAGFWTGASQYVSSPTIGSSNKIKWQLNSATGFRENIGDVALELLPSSSPPATPTITKVNTLNSTAINGTWNKPTGTAWFWFNATLSGGATTHINTTKTTITLNNYTAGSKYTFSVIAANATGKSSSSITKYNYTYNVAATVPTISSILSTQARLGWTNPGSGANLTGGFNIYKVTALGSNYTLVAQTSNNTNHYDLASLLGNREYTAKLATRYAVGTNYTGASANSTTVTFYTIPGTPTGLTITQTRPLIAHLSWTQAVDNGTVSGSKIERSNNGGTSYTTILANTGNTTAAYNDTLPSAGTYTYKVSTIKYGGTSVASSPASRSIWNSFTVNAYHHDGTTPVYGQVIQYNSTSSNNRFTLVSGQAVIPGISQLNNFTAWNSLINFIVGKQYNYNATTNHSLNMTTNDYDIDCSSTGVGIDVELWTNGTNGHNISTFTTPTCFANNTVKWSTKFTANGNDPATYSTLVYVRAVNATFGTVAPLKYNSTKVPTAFTNPYIISDPVTVGTGLQTKLFNWSMNLTVSPAFTPVNSTVGHISVSGVNPVTMPIKFSTNVVNSSATAVTVTFPSTYTMAYNVTFGNEGTTHMYKGLPVTSPSLGVGQSVITFKNPGNDFVTIKAYDTVTNTTASTILAQPNTNIPFVTQFKNFKNGLFGTSAMIGGINIVDLIVLMVAMIGLNRANEIVGAFMMVIIVGVAGFFQIITWPTAMVSAIALAVLVTVVTMKKYQNS